MKLSKDIWEMPISVEILGVRDPKAQIEAVFAYFQHVDDIFSTYRSDSQISRYNERTLTLTNASSELRTVLRTCEDLKVETGGYFNAEQNGYCDPSGYVKGWAIYNAARMLDRMLITRYCINAGGDMQTSGYGPQDSPWVIAVKNPFDLSRSTKMLLLQNAAIATSGTYERGSHIYNPVTGLPVTNPVSLTVIGPTIDRVDALATACICMGTQGLTFLQDRNFEAMQIAQDGTVTLTPGFKRYEATYRNND
jgi:thiamine biosynthesis lipoprotein